MTNESNILAREGYFILVLFFLLAVVLCLWNLIAGFVGILWFLFCVFFFRNPSRVKEYEKGLLIAPADGRVIHIDTVEESCFLKKPMLKISIFMSPFDVHVNRAPVAGQVVNKKYFKGDYLAAFSKDASEKNERSVLHVKTDNGDDIVFMQIAGWFARRIITYPNVGDDILQGYIFGLIKFGSRMDLYFPKSYKPAVVLRQKVKAGQSVVARKA